MRLQHPSMAKILAALIPFALALGVAGCSGDSGMDAGAKPGDDKIADSGADKDSSAGRDDSKVESGTDDENKPIIKKGECDFKKDDKVWAFAFVDGNDSTSSETIVTFTYDGENSKDSVYMVTKGRNAFDLCEELDDKKVDEHGSSGVKIVETYWCEGETLFYTQVMTGDVAHGISRSEAFEKFKEECEDFSKGRDSDEEDDDSEIEISSNGKAQSVSNEEESFSSRSGKDGKSSSSSENEAEEAESSSSEAEEESSSSVGGSASGSVCNFKKEDKVWVMDVTGVARITLTWSGNDYTAVTEMSMKLSDEATCEASVANADPEDNAYCEGSVYKSNPVRVVKDADRDEVYDESMAMCAL